MQELNVGSWENWIQDVGKMYIGTKVQAQYQAPVELEKMRITARSEYGEPYTEGETTQSAAAPRQIIPGVPNTWLLIGGAVVLVVLLRD